MKIKTIPKEINSALYNKQKEQAMRFIKDPIVMVESSDPSMS
jgi:hypothetical protein